MSFAAYQNHVQSTWLPMDKGFQLKKPAEYGRLLAEYISTFILLPESAWQLRSLDQWPAAWQQMPWQHLCPL